MNPSYTISGAKGIAQEFTNYPEYSDAPSLCRSVNRAVLGGKLALAGYLVHYAADGGYMVLRADMNKVQYCHDFAELQAFARLVEVLQHG